MVLMKEVVGVDLSEVLDKIVKIDEASSILLDLLEGKGDEEQVIRLRKLAKEFVEDFKLSGPIAWLVKVLPERPVLPTTPLLTLFLKTVDREGLKNVLTYLKGVSATIMLLLQQSIQQVDPPTLTTAVRVVPKAYGRLLESLTYVYLCKVRGWPELYPTDLIPFIRFEDEKGAHKRGSPDLYTESCVEPKIHAANVSKSLKEINEYIDSATYIANIVSDYATRMKANKVELKYGIVVYELVDAEKRDKVLKVFEGTVLENAKSRLSKEKLLVEIFDLESIEQDLSSKKKENPFANHLYATLREMGLVAGKD
jgi:hypothetical protein